MDPDPEGLNCDQMKAIFEQMRTLRGFVDDNVSGRERNLAIAMAISGEAAFQIMDDGAKGEFVAADEAPGENSLCASAQGEGFLDKVDSFAMFEVDGDDRVAGQKLLAEPIMGPTFQETFNLDNGSIPAHRRVAGGIRQLRPPLALGDEGERRSRLPPPLLRPRNGAERRAGGRDHRRGYGAFKLGHERGRGGADARRRRRQLDAIA